MDEEDEVARRAREAAERRAEVEEERRVGEERSRHRTAEVQTALSRLIQEVATQVTARTSYPVFQTPDGIACFLGPQHAYRSQPLFFATLTEDSLDIEDRNWSIGFNCEAPIILDEDGERSSTDEQDLQFGEACAYGVEAVLGGLAALVGADEEILSPDAVRVDQPPEEQPPQDHAALVAAERAPVPKAVPRPAVLFGMGVLIGSALLVLTIRLIALLGS